MYKHCSKCLTDKPISDFYSHPHTSDRLRATCKSCYSINTIENRRKNPDLHNATQQRRRVRQREENPEQFYTEKRAQHKAWRDVNPDKILKHRSKALRKYHYGITLEVFQQWVAAQNGRCAICKEVPTKTLQVDHDHATGQLRDLLCMSCNSGLGFLKDSQKILKAALRYLKKHGGGYGPKS